MARMLAVWMHLQVELRARWRAMLGLALLVGVVSGTAIAAAAGARRTDSAYPRFLEKYGVFQASVSTGNNPQTDQIFNEIAHLPQVVATSRTSLFTGTLTARGHTVSFPDVLVLAQRDAQGSFDEVKVVRGRLPDPDAIDEAVAGYALAEQLGLKPGDSMTLTVALPAGTEGASTGKAEPQTLRLVGVAAFVGGFETLTGRGFPNVIGLTPAFFRAHESAVDTTADELDVALRRGDSDLPAFAEEIRRRNIAIDGPVQVKSAFTSDVQAVNRVPVVTLWAAAGILALAGVAIFAQAVARETAARGHDFPTLRALGMSRAALTAFSIAKVALVAAGGAAISLGVALLLSPLMPLGLARIAEPSPGFAADWLVLSVGVAATFLLVSVAGVLPARRAARGAEFGVRVGGGRPSTIVRAVARVGVPPSMTAGLLLATRAAGPTEPVPARTAFLAAASGIAAVTAALVFASSLDHLVRSPNLLGYSWDAAVVAGSSSVDDLEGSLPREIVADTWKGSVFAQTRVDDLLLAAFVSDGPPPSIIDGRSPVAADEIALDPKSLDRLDKGLGDTVSVAGTPGPDGVAPPPTSRRMRIVGSFAVPRLPFQANENAAQGAAFTPAGFTSVSPDTPFDSVCVKFRAGVDAIDGVQRLKEATAGRAFAVLSTQKVGAVRGVQRISAVPWFLGGILGFLAVGTLTHTLLLTIRRRRRDLAIVKTLGFVGWQIRATVAWFAVAIVAPALLLGLPIGIIVGRWGWRLFARYLAVVPDPIAPAVGTLIVALGVVAIANVIAAVPAHIAARTRPASVFQTE